MRMHCRALVFLALCGLAAQAAAATIQPSSTDPAAHAAHMAPEAAHALERRWASDAALRQGMQRVRAALSQLRHHERQHMPAEAAREQAAQIEAAIHFLFASCRLPPDADAALHQILLPLLQAARQLQSDPADRAAVAALRAAVAPYPRQFDDPGWAAAPEAAPAQ